MTRQCHIVGKSGDCVLGQGQESSGARLSASRGKTLARLVARACTDPRTPPLPM